MLLDRGYETKEINLLMTEDTRQRYFYLENKQSPLNNKANETRLDIAVEGTMKGAMIGTLLAACSNIIFPGFGLFLGGPLFIGLGAITGGLRGAFTTSGIPEEQAQEYERAVQEGQIVMVVKTRNKADAEYFKRQWPQADE